MGPCATSFLWRRCLVRFSLRNTLLHLRFCCNSCSSNSFELLSMLGHMRASCIRTEEPIACSLQWQWLFVLRANIIFIVLVLEFAGSPAFCWYQLGWYSFS